MTLKNTMLSHIIVSLIVFLSAFEPFALGSPLTLLHFANQQESEKQRLAMHKTKG